MQGPDNSHKGFLGYLHFIPCMGALIKRFMQTGVTRTQSYNHMKEFSLSVKEIFWGTLGVLLGKF